MQADLKRLVEAHLPDEPATLDELRVGIAADAAERKELMAEFERRTRATRLVLEKSGTSDDPACDRPGPVGEG
jgi:hypothetical protein